MSARIRQRRIQFEPLETRDLLTSVPFGASTQDVAEYLLGDVSVTVVFLESNGQIDADTEDWSPELTANVKANIESGLQWWVDTLATYSDVHTLSFHVDYQYADNPVEIPYEPISRPSQDFRIWMEAFFRHVDVPASAGFSNEIRTFNHQQRVRNDTNWSFTIFVVNAENDPNDRFGDANAGNTAFQRAFAFPGGQFIVMPHSRPASTVAHELGHIFWGNDEYANSDHYSLRRGYYATQNTNAADGHPNPDSREPSLMASTGAPYRNHELSTSARETIGWRDSDGDGIFDVLDVPHSLHGVVSFNPQRQTFQFLGRSSVQTLPNQNPSGTQNDITINRITHLQYRIEGGLWTNLVEADDYEVAFDVVTPPIPSDAQVVEFRTIDARSGVVSNVVTGSTLDPAPHVFQNPMIPPDVTGDGYVTAIDALHVINAINDGNTTPSESGPPYLDVSGDGFVSSRDVLIVINYINDQSVPANPVVPDFDPPTLSTSLKIITSTITPTVPPGTTESAGEPQDLVRAAVWALFDTQDPAESDEADWWA